MTSRIIDIHTHKTSALDALTIKTIGIHPYNICKESATRLDIKDINPSIEAIGETGLDYSIDCDKGLQLEFFEEQLEIAQTLNLPVIIHCVKAFEPTMCALRKRSLKAVIFHGFIGSKEQAQQAINQGYYLSFGERTLSSPKSIEALRSTPLDRLFYETDCSELEIEEIYERLEIFRTESIEEQIDTIYNNFQRIFR